MRILRLYSPSLSGDHTECYLSATGEGTTYADDAESPIFWARAGEALDAGKYLSGLTIVLPPQATLNEGDFLSVSSEGTLLRLQDKCLCVCRKGFVKVSEHAEVWPPIRTAVLTVSDKGSRGERVDTAGPELAGLAFMLGCVVEDRKIVPDDPEEICNAVLAWSQAGINLVLTTGGTGLSPRDRTPEALLSIADRVVPGFGEIMRAATLKYTKRAFLTRSVAVITGQTLVIAFPGSRRGAGQCFDAISGGLRHAVETLTGKSSECGEEHHH